MTSKLLLPLEHLLQTNRNSYYHELAQDVLLARDVPQLQCLLDHEGAV